MSGHGFHVHGHHEHVLEHQAHDGGKLSQYVAIFTALLSTAGAIISYQGSDTQVEAMLYKNEAVLKKAQASDQWNYYQAKAQKGHMMELAMDLAPPGRKEFYKQKIAKYDADKKKIQAEAEALETATKKADEKSESLMKPHRRLELAMAMTQIAISLASITVLTRQRWLFGIAAAAAAGGGALWIGSLFL